MEGMSYNEIIDMVHCAWHSSRNDDYSEWIQDTYPDHVVVRVDGKFWNVPYSTVDGEIGFASNNEWKEVELKKEWVAKNESVLFAIKSLQPKEEGEIRIGGYGVLWGDKNRKDLHGEYFTKKTKQLTAVFDAMGNIPFMFNHGVDDTLKATVIGAVDVLESDDVGVWWEAKIKEHALYRKYVEPLLENGALFSSSGTLPAAKKSIKGTGEITNWVIMEMTGTHTPAEYRMLSAPIATVKNYYSFIESVGGINPTDINDVFKSIGLEEEVETVETEPPQGDEKSNGNGDELAGQLFTAQLELEKLTLETLLGG